MSDKDLGQQFFATLQQKAMDRFKDKWKSQLYPIQYPTQGDFKYWWQNPSQVFNKWTYDYISARISPGDVPGTIQLSPSGGFPNVYAQVLSTIAFALNPTDAQALNTAESQASAQLGAVVSQYQTTFGQITKADMDKAGVATPGDYIVSYILGEKWSGASPALTWVAMSQARNLDDLLPKRPPTGESVIGAVTNYLGQLGPAIPLKDQVSAGQWTLRTLRLNTTNATASNGGMQVADPNTGAITNAVGYTIAEALTDIRNQLTDTSNPITLTMTTKAASGDEVEVSIEGKTGFTVGSWLKFDMEASGSYEMSKSKGTSSETTVSIEFNGPTMVPVVPVPFQQFPGTGWYSEDVLSQAAKNTGGLTGFKFGNPPPVKQGGLSAGGDFGLLTNLLISQYPTIKITYKNANYKDFQQNWKQNASGNLTLFGFMKLGSFKQGSFGSSFESGSDNSTFTVTFGPSKEVLSVPDLQKQAYVIAGACKFPLATS